jgi:3-hydroxy-3-methylglutaryl CoA synthase
MNMMSTSATDYTYAVFHQPNVKFPSRAAQLLGFKSEQIAPGLLAGDIGNVYSGSCMLGLTAILDNARPGDHILMVSYGSGAGSDAFDIRVTERIDRVRHLAPATTITSAAARDRLRYLLPFPRKAEGLTGARPLFPHGPQHVFRKLDSYHDSL